MNTVRVLYHLALADFYERARRYQFLLTLAMVIYLGVQVNNGTWFLYLTSLDFSGPLIGYRGEFNSAWIGAMTALVTNCVLGLFGFYLVNDCIQRDMRTGVGQIIATTPVSRPAYLVGKWLSNILVLVLLVAILVVSAVIMVLFQSNAGLDLTVLLMPFVVVALPYMVLIAALAVVFETVPWLRGAVGNVIYFFLWLLLTVVSVLGGLVLPSLRDPQGVNLFRASLAVAAQATFPGKAFDALGLQAGNPGGIQFNVFYWPGLDWTPDILATQWAWAVFGLGLILLSALWFARFDPSREGLLPLRATPEQGKEDRLAGLLKLLPVVTLPDLSPLISRLAQVNPFLGVLFAELRMLLKSRRWWWWLVFAGLIIGIFTSSNQITLAYLIPFSWLWPLAIWSEMGNRERKNSTYQMVFSSARPVLRQLPAAWLAGVLATVLLGIGTAIFCLANGDLPGLAGWAGAVVFVPTLALALGVFSSGSKTFEVVYILLWYIGPFQKMPGLNFLSGAPGMFLLAAAGLLLLAAFWRGSQVRV